MHITKVGNSGNHALKLNLQEPLFSDHAMSYDARDPARLMPGDHRVSRTTLSQYVARCFDPYILFPVLLLYVTLQKLYLH